MADLELTKPGSPTKRVTMSTSRSPIGSREGQRSAPGSGKKTPTDYSRPIVRSAVRRWKRMHEQSMMEKLVGMRNEKKELTKLSREDARKVARKIPIEILAKEWLNDNEATLEVRAYLVDKVLPTLILGVEKLLDEAKNRGLTEEDEEEDPDFNPINFLGQYLMRNNPRYSNFSEASPYVRGLREVAEELKKQLFNIEDNRLARIKAEAKRRREERDRLEQLKQQERERRESEFMKQFETWNVQPDGRVELSLVQNALRSFVEIAESFPEELRDGFRLSHALEPTDESGKALSVKEFAKYLSLFTDDFSKEIFDQFMIHLAKCAQSHRKSSNQEQRRILLTNLFISCDHSGIGLLDRHRILSLFESFWDSIKEDLKTNLRNPRRWPVAEIDEVEDYFDEDDFMAKPNEGKEQTTQEEQKVEQTATPAPTITVEQTQADTTPQEATPQEKTEEQEQTQQQTEEKPEEEKKVEVTQEQQEQSSEEKPDTEAAKPEEKPDEQAAKPDEKPEEQAKTEEKPEEQAKTEEKPDEQAKTEEKPDEQAKTEEKPEEQAAKPEEKTETPAIEQESQEKASEEQQPKVEKPEEKKPEEEKKEEEGKDLGLEKEKSVVIDVGDKDAGEDDAKEKSDLKSPRTETTGVIPASQADRASVTFAEGTTFSREKTALTHISRGSGQSAFDENSLNVSQFVQLTETFLGNEPEKPAFDNLSKFIRDGYEETEEEKMERLMKARKEALSSQRKHMMDTLFEKWDNDGSGYLDLDEVEIIMQKYKEGQEKDAILRAKVALKKQSKYADNRLSKREFRTFIQLVVDEMTGADTFEDFIDFLIMSVERTYAERIRGEARKKWLQQVVTAAETGGASMEPVYRAVFQALYKDSEAHGGGKRISANLSMLERNNIDPPRGNVCLRYVAATMDDADYLLGKILYKDMKGISFAAVETGKPIHVPRVANHGNIQFWNPYRLPEDREGSFIVVPLKDKRKRVFGLLGVDTMNDRHTKTIFITHEILYFQGVAKAFSIAYHHVDMRKKLLRITESAVSWIHRRSPHVVEIVTYMVEPDNGKDYILRKMMTTDEKGNVQNLQNPPRLERKDNLFRDYLFKCVDNSETVSADAYGQRHLAFPLRDDQGRAVAVVDISIGELKHLPEHENREVQRMLKLLNQAHKEITREFSGDDKTVVLEAEKDDENRMDIMFDRLMLMELRENVSKIDMKAFAELRSYNDPPKIIQNIVKATCAIFHMDLVDSGELDDWTNLRTFINQELLQKITEYDPTAASDHNLIPPEKIEVFLKDVPHGEVGKFGSLPAQNMYNWVFVCISLIEHTIKMRENNGGNVVASTQQGSPVETQETD